MPQALTWNIGTIGMTTSRADMFIASGIDAAKEWMTLARCENSTPFGLPVVPEV